MREMRCFSLSPDNAWKKEKGNGAQPNYKPKARKMNACWICACIFFFEKKATVRKRSGREAHAALLVQMDILVVFVRVDELRHNLRDNLEHALGRRAGLVNCNNTRKRRARQRKGRWAMLTTTATTTTTRATAMMILLHCRKLPQRAKCANLFPCCGVPSLPLLCCFALLLCFVALLVSGVCVCTRDKTFLFGGAKLHALHFHTDTGGFRSFHLPPSSNNQNVCCCFCCVAAAWACVGASESWHGVAASKAHELHLHRVPAGPFLPVQLFLHKRHFL